MQRENVDEVNDGLAVLDDVVDDVEPDRKQPGSVPRYRQHLLVLIVRRHRRR